ncbi:TetR family transcriptional regulator C-terminal domain-containing protein [Phytohabitans sp. ZYX-F-186]|uniref:TetR family transcriptional regulator C-terminal domain-containing protein n=1 Tax=Phytohabitans maris TaxID=3071409 RepID=A0ABU0ZIC8_9ACTN|nr:TetR family transcriptional regulator C-terminal domain-containing protein [Phytohabitans sp. ZYX-F-186]MDQ7906814.1 TetR family transcriptional regulator C-terminal domain-containing protein [Phytohabitans sp. ZYX-F-186]
MARTADRPAQEALLSRAVWDVLAHQGLERLTIRAVAAAAGCTTGLVMHRFPHRRALLLHARRLLHERTRARVEALEASSATPREALRAVLRQGLSLDDELRTESTVWVGFLAAAVADDELIAQHRANNQAWRQRITRLVAAAAPDWSAERAAAVASTLIALVEGAAALGSGDPAGYPPAVQERVLDDTLAAYGLARVY